MIEINQKWNKVEIWLATIICWLLGLLFLLLVVGVALDILFEEKVFAVDYGSSYFGVVKYILLFGFGIVVLLLIPAMIAKSKTPAREDIVDDQLLTLLQRTENIEKRLTKNEQEVAEMEDQMRNAIKCPLRRLTDRQIGMLREILLLVACPKNLETKILNRAKTAQFLRALQLLGYIDAAESGNTLRLWVEQVTGWRDPDKYHFTEAYTQANKRDKKVQKMMVEIEEDLKFISELK